MNEQERLSALIAGVYDAALNPSSWRGVLRRAKAFVGGCSATLSSKDVVNQNSTILYDCGAIQPYYTELYLTQYVKLDPTTTGQFLADIEKPISTTDILVYEDFLDTRFYKEWAKPQGLVDFLSAVLDKSAANIVMFGVFRHKSQGLADAEMRRRMRLIVPHIRRSVLIGRAAEMKSAEAASLVDACNNLTAGMFLLDANSRIIHANSSGHSMLAQGSMLRAAGDKLAIINEAGTQRALSEVVTVPGNADAAAGTRGIALALTGQDGERYVAHALPLTSGARRSASIADAASVALFIRKVTMDTRSPLEIVAKLYKLTPTEVRVLVGCVEVGGVPEVAATLGIGETTVKTHLHRVFAKTSTKRQADLVKLLAGYSSPLLP